MDYQSFQPGGQDQNQPLIPPVVPTPSMPKKNFTPKFVGVIVGLLVLGGVAFGGYWWEKQYVQVPITEGQICGGNAAVPNRCPDGYYCEIQKNGPTDAPGKCVKDDTSTWKIYRNDQYGFEFKYPTIWMVKDDTYVQNGQTYLLFHITSPDRFNLPGYQDVGVHYLIQIAVNPMSEVETVSDFAKAKIVGDQSPWNTNLSRDITQTTDEYQIGQQILSTFKFISPLINSFQSCADAGYPIMESYPEKCRTPDGLTFTKYDACIQVITRARNPQTGEEKDFPTPCDVPEGWEKI